MKVFNAFQITAAFVAWPFLIAWLNNAQFNGAGAAYISAIALYVVAFSGMVACVYNAIDKG